MKFYSDKNIRAKNALYNVIFRERSNGKTFVVLRETTIKGHCETCALYNSLGCPYAPNGGNGRCDEWRPE